MESNTNAGVALSDQLRADLRLAWSLTQEAGHTTAADRIFAFIGSAACAAPGVPAAAKLTRGEARTILNMALDLEKTGRICSLSDGHERAKYVESNRAVQCALTDVLESLTVPRAKGNPDDWMMDGSLIYRLNERGANCDEINVTMAHGSRDLDVREAYAGGLLNLICAAPVAPAGISQQAGGAAPVDLPPLPEPWIHDMNRGVQEAARKHYAEDQMIDYGKACFAAGSALAVPVQADRMPEPKLCDFGNPDDFVDAHADWARQKKDEQIGAAEYKGNTISYMYSKAKNYGNVLVECCNLLGGDGHVIDRIKTLLAERDRLAATPVAPPASPSADTERMDYIEKHATLGGTYRGITSANVIVHEGEWHELGLRAAIDAMKARDPALPGSTPDAAQGGA